MKICKLVSILLFPFSSCFTQPDATILYFNDAHEISPVKDEMGERGGIARVKTVIDIVKNENPNTLVLFGGDLAGGSLFGGFYHGFPMVNAFNILPVDIASFGQHDFDFGTDNTRALVDSSQFKWSSSNLTEKDGTPFANTQPFIIRNMNGLQIAFMGFTDAMNTTGQHDEVIQKEIPAAAKDVYKSLANIELDAVIAITQTTLEENKNLLRACPFIDIIFTEEQYENNSLIFYFGQKPIISTCGNMGSIARLDINKKNSPKFAVSVYPVDSTITNNQEMYKFQTGLQKKLENELSTPLAMIKTPLEAGIYNSQECRWKETNIGNLITDAVRDAAGTDIALWNGGGIRASIPAGIMTIKDARAVLPFNNRILVLKIKGRELFDLLELGVSHVETKGGQFLHISGGTYSYDWSAPVGKRIQSVTIQGNPLDRNKTFSVALSEFLAAPDNDFKKVFKNLNLDSTITMKKIDYQIFSDYCKQQAIINSNLEGRIVVLNKKEE